MLIANYHEDCSKLVTTSARAENINQQSNQVLRTFLASIKAYAQNACIAKLG